LHKDDGDDDEEGDAIYDVNNDGDDDDNS